MTTYTWVTAGFSNSGAIAPFAHEVLELVAPAGATWRRFIVKGTAVNGLTTGNDVRYLNSWSQETTIQFRAGGFIADREIFRQSCAVPTEITSLYDDVTFERIYTQILNGGDREFGIDQQTAYGKQSDLNPSRLHFDTFLTRASLAGGTLGTMVGTWNATFWGLYSQPGP